MLRATESADGLREDPVLEIVAGKANDPTGRSERQFVEADLLLVSAPRVGN